MNELQQSPDDLADFLRGIERVDCVLLEARHLISGQEGGSAVATFEREKCEDESAAPAFNAEEIYAKLAEDAQGIGGTQKYVLLAFKKGNKTPRERHILKVDGGASDEPAALGANSHIQAAMGLLNISHKHIEQLVRGLANTVNITVSSTQKMVADQARMADALIDRLEKSEAEKVEMWGTVRDIMKVSREDKVLEMQAAQSAEQSKLMGDGVRLLMQTIQMKVLPGNAKVQASGLGAFLGSLTDEQRAKIFSELSPAQQAHLGTLIDDLMKAEPQNGVSETKGN